MTRAEELPALLARGGTYVVQVRLAAVTPFTAGALGPIRLPRGTHLYVGSARRALGPRLLRHLTRASAPPQRLWSTLARAATPPQIAPRPKRLRWHLDYLLQSPSATLDALTLLPDQECECALARSIGALPGVLPSAPGFGSSDCRQGCGAHFFFVPRGRARSVEQVLRARSPVWQVRLTRAGKATVRCLCPTAAPVLL